MESNRKAVLLNSGGIDSRLVAALLQKQEYELHSLLVHWNKQTDPVAIPAAAETARLYCADHFVFEYPVDWSIQKTSSFGIPFNIAAIHIIGAQYAFRLGCGLVATGLRKENDRADRIQLLQNSLYDVTLKHSIIIIAPIFDLPNVTPNPFKVSLADTYSCNHYPPCGKCSSCKRRKQMGLT